MRLPLYGDLTIFLFRTGVPIMLDCAHSQPGRRMQTPSRSGGDMEVRQSINSEYAKTLDTAGLRKEFLVEKVFEPDALALTYSHIDRIIVGGAFPQTRAVEVPGSLGKSIGVSYLLERRELGAINIGGDGWVEADGKRF